MNAAVVSAQAVERCKNFLLQNFRCVFADGRSLEDLHGILSHEQIRRGERQTESLRLTNQHSVKRITVQRRQSAQLRNGGFIQNQRRNEVFLALHRDKLRGRLWQRQFAETVFEGDFPK